MLDTFVKQLNRRRGSIITFILIALCVSVLLHVLDHADVKFSSSGNAVRNLIVKITRQSPNPAELYNLLNLKGDEIAKTTKCNMIKFSPKKIGITLDLCSYEKDDDQFITGELMKTGFWESNSMTSLESLFAIDPSLNLIDIGANIGLYSLTAAKWGRRVIAVEANPDNAYKLMTSVVKNNLQSQITVLNNAVSDEYAKLKMVVDKINRGGSIIMSDKASNSSRSGIPKGREEYVADVQAILMDDLLPLIHFDKAVLKIDIEGYEAIAFSKAGNLFKNLKICYVFMEWTWLKAEKKGGDRFVYNFLTEHGFKPYDNPAFSGMYLTELSDSWPYDVFWKNTNC